MIQGKNSLRQFSDKQHEKEKWSSNYYHFMLPLLRPFINFISLKRYYVYKLAKKRNRGLTLEIGSGKGAYSNWFSKFNRKSTIIATDWSFNAIKDVKGKSKILKVVADAQYLPFKHNVFSNLFSVDTLGHIEKPTKCLDEILRVSTNSSDIFLHSECSDYKNRWPDRVLINKLGKDLIAEKDGHFFIKDSTSLYNLFHQRFFIKSFIAPAGITGWLTGYPENYCKLFKEVKYYHLWIITSIMAGIKKTPILKQILQLFNAFLNKVEIYFGISGGGSVFSELKNQSKQ